MYLDTQNPVNRRHPLARSLAVWYLSVPTWMGGPKWWDLFAGNHGQLRGMNNTNNGWRSTTRPGGFGSLLFDGTSGFVDTPNSAQINGITNSIVSVMAWINFPSLPNPGPTIFSVWDGTLGYQLVINKVTATTGNLLGWSDTGHSVIGVNVLNANIWYHVAGVWDGTNNYLYVNGVFDTSAARTFRASTLDSQIGIQANGAGGTGTSFPWKGNIDDVRIYNRPLSALDVQDAYHNSKLGYPGLLNYRKPYLSVLPQISVVRFRKTLSALGTRTGKRQPRSTTRGL